MTRRKYITTVTINHIKMWKEHKEMSKKSKVNKGKYNSGRGYGTWGESARKGRRTGDGGAGGRGADASVAVQLSGHYFMQGASAGLNGQIDLQSI